MSSPPPPATEPRVRWRRAAVAAGMVLGAAVLAVAAAAPGVLAARDDLAAGRTAAEAGRDLAAGDAAAARHGFQEAFTSFDRAQDRLTDPLSRPARAVPVASGNLRTATAIATAGRDAAAAATVVTDALLGLPGGPGDLAPRAGRIPVEQIAALAGPLERASSLLEQARAALDAAPRRLLTREVADAHAELAEVVDSAGGAASAAARLSRALPPYLGADGPRRYLFAAQNPAELRGTGGLLGVFAIATADRGRVRLSDFDRIGVLPDVPASEAQAPNPDYAARYDRFGGAGFWKNLNMTPDVPSAAEAMTWLYKAVAGGRLDGVLFADPMLLAGLLDVTGPVEVKPFGTVESSGVVDLVTNTAHAVLTSNEERTGVLGGIAKATLDRFLGGDIGDPAEAVRALAEATAGGHLLLYSAHTDEQEAFDHAAISGRLPRAQDSVLAVAVNNEGGNKLDYFAERTVDYTVRLLDDGSARGELTVTLANDADLRGQPAYVTGVTDELPPGEYRQIVSVFCGVCEITEEHSSWPAPEPCWPPGAVPAPPPSSTRAVNPDGDLAPQLPG